MSLKNYAEALDNLNLKKDSLSSIELTDYKMNHLTYKSQSQYPAFAVFSEVYYPKGWQAYIDGEAVEHIQVDYTLRGLSIPSGRT